MLGRLNCHQVGPNSAESYDTRSRVDRWEGFKLLTHTGCMVKYPQVVCWVLGRFAKPPNKIGRTDGQLGREKRGENLCLITKGKNDTKNVTLWKVLSARTDRKIEIETDLKKGFFQIW